MNEDRLQNTKKPLKVDASMKKGMDAHIPNLQLKLLCVLPNVTFHEDPETYEAYAYMTLQHVLTVYSKKECQTLQSVVSNDELNQGMYTYFCFSQLVVADIM
ncbi:hypothetical protein Tco_1325043 [Tanacetum coccineum]